MKAYFLVFGLSGSMQVCFNNVLAKSNTLGKLCWVK